MNRSEYIRKLTDAIEGALNSEYDATQIYDGILVTANEVTQDSTTLNLINSVISDIRNEEEKHIVDFFGGAALWRNDCPGQQLGKKFAGRYTTGDCESR